MYGFEERDKKGKQREVKVAGTSKIFDIPYRTAESFKVGYPYHYLQG